MDILVCNKQGLQLFNTFKHQSAEDFIYYTLFICEQLELNTDKIDCCLLGEIDKPSGIYDLAYKYIRNIRFIKRNENIQLSPVINQIPEHFYYPLFTPTLVRIIGGKYKEKTSLHPEIYRCDQQPILPQGKPV